MIDSGAAVTPEGERKHSPKSEVAEVNGKAFPRGCPRRRFSRAQLAGVASCAGAFRLR